MSLRSGIARRAEGVRDAKSASWYQCVEVVTNSARNKKRKGKKNKVPLGIQCSGKSQVKLLEPCQ